MKTMPRATDLTSEQEAELEAALMSPNAFAPRAPDAPKMSPHPGAIRYEKPEEALTNERGKTHGDFVDHARITQRLKLAITTEYEHRRDRGQLPLSDTQREAIDMIVHKIGRIIAGDPSFADHWDDIAGYAHIANKQ